MTDLLFVYGTLRSGLDHPQAKWLSKKSVLLGASTVQGRLYRISWYPGLVSTKNPKERVTGDLLRLTDPSSGLVQLDEYEGVAEGEYERKEVSLEFEGSEVNAWVYFYVGSTEELRWIPSGDFIQDLNVHFD
ncbi:MAG: gamma-glutamylcyclotransferase family protein [Bacteroidota bacterium]